MTGIRSSDEDLIECWFSRLAAPVNSNEVGLAVDKRASAPLEAAERVGEAAAKLAGRVRAGPPFILERLIKVHREPRNDLFKKAK